jgi:hypothetical protein
MVLGAYYYRIDGVISVRLATGLFMSFCSMMALQELIGTPVSKQLLARRGDLLRVHLSWHW